MRAVSVPFSPARPSRLKNEPGILPAAYMRSSTSTVSGRKSTSRRLPTVAVLRTIVSPWRTTTAPAACLASLPVSNEISLPAISTETVLTASLLIWTAFPCPPFGRRAESSDVSESERDHRSEDARRPSGGPEASAWRSRRRAARRARRGPRARPPRVAAVGLEALHVEAELARSAPTGADRRCAPGRRTARRAWPRTRPGAPAASAAWASGHRARGAWPAARSGGRRRGSGRRRAAAGRPARSAGR